MLPTLTHAFFTHAFCRLDNIRDFRKYVTPQEPESFREECSDRHHPPAGPVAWASAPVPVSDVSSVLCKQLLSLARRNAEMEFDMRSRVDRFPRLLPAVLLALLLGLPTLATAAMVGNPACPGEEVFFNPGNGEDIVVPSGFKVEVFAKGLNFPTAVAFRGNAQKFEVFVLESGHGLPSRCNDETLAVFGGEFSLTIRSRPTSWCSTRAGP